MSQRPFVIVIGASFLPYWTDKPLAHLFASMVFKGKVAIISDTEYEFNKAYHTHVVIAIGGPVSNRIAGEISLLHPAELFEGRTSRRGAIYWRGGIKKTENGYECWDPCLLIGGRRIRDTVNAVFQIMRGEGKTLFEAFIGADWDSLPVGDQSKWRKKYWNGKSENIDDRVPQGAGSRAEERVESIRRAKSAHAPTEVTERQVESVFENEFIEEGEVWMIRYKSGNPFRVTSRNGLIYLSRLLEKPHERFHCNQLLQLTLPSPIAEGNGGNIDFEDGLAEQSQSGRIQMLGKKEIKALQRRLEDITEDLRMPELSVDKRDELQEEKTKIEKELKKNAKYGMIISNDDKKKMAAVMKNIKDSITAINKFSPDLASHLNGCIHGGMRPSYEPASEIKWNVQLKNK